MRLFKDATKRFQLNLIEDCIMNEMASAGIGTIAYLLTLADEDLLGSSGTVGFH